MQNQNSMFVNYSEAFAFLGNSFLEPMSMTGSAGLEPNFWDAFSVFQDDKVAACVKSCDEYARSAQRKAEAGVDIVQECSVEFTHLFVGPPRPAVAPWETFHAGEETTVGFGQPTFEMQSLLRDAGLEINNENNQYADHIGIELLYLSVLCTRAAQSDDYDLAQMKSFVIDHPVSWLPAFIEALNEDSPEGYFVRLARLSESLLNHFLSEID